MSNSYGQISRDGSIERKCGDMDDHLIIEDMTQYENLDESNTYLSNQPNLSGKVGKQKELLISKHKYSDTMPMDKHFRVYVTDRAN